MHRPRPGHADLNGGLKYNLNDLRNVLERSSARETAARVACGAVARQLLARVRHQGRRTSRSASAKWKRKRTNLPLDELIRITEESPVRVVDKEAEAKMIAHIDQVKKEGDSIGGIVEMHRRRRAGRTRQPCAMGSQAGRPHRAGGRVDQRVQRRARSASASKRRDCAARRCMTKSCTSEERGFYRATNRLGGFEGGMTNGEPIVVRGVMKPIPTLYKPLRSVDIDTKEPFTAQVERSDSCAVPAGERRHGACRRLGSGAGVPGEVRRRFDGRNPREPTTIT